MKSRELDYRSIHKAIKSNIHTEVENAILLAGDSLDILKEISDNSISLILTDPPYHVTKKKNIYGDTQFEQDSHYLEWMALFAKE